MEKRIVKTTSKANPFQHGISGRELGRILGNEEAGGFILRGERSITVDQAKKLGARFSVDPLLFLDL